MVVIGYDGGSVAWHRIAGLRDRAGIEGEAHSASACVVVGYDGEVPGASVLGELQLGGRGPAPSSRLVMMCVGGIVVRTPMRL